MATFLQLLGLSLILGVVVMAVLWPLLWALDVFEGPGWLEAIKARLAGGSSQRIAKSKV